LRVVNLESIIFFSFHRGERTSFLGRPNSLPWERFFPSSAVLKNANFSSRLHFSKGRGWSERAKARVSGYNVHKYSNALSPLDGGRKGELSLSRLSKWAVRASTLFLHTLRGGKKALQFVSFPLFCSFCHMFHKAFTCIPLPSSHGHPYMCAYPTLRFVLRERGKKKLSHIERRPFFSNRKFSFPLSSFWPFSSRFIGRPLLPSSTPTGKRGTFAYFARFPDFSGEKRERASPYNVLSKALSFPCKIVETAVERRLLGGEKRSQRSNQERKFVCERISIPPTKGELSLLSFLFFRLEDQFMDNFADWSRRLSPLASLGKHMDSGKSEFFWEEKGEKARVKKDTHLFFFLLLPSMFDDVFPPKERRNRRFVIFGRR